MAGVFEFGLPQPTRLVYVPAEIFALDVAESSYGSLSDY